MQQSINIINYFDPQSESPIQEHHWWWITVWKGHHHPRSHQFWRVWQYHMSLIQEKKPNTTLFEILSLKCHNNSFLLIRETEMFLKMYLSPEWRFFYGTELELHFTTGLISMRMWLCATAMRMGNGARMKLMSSLWLK